MNETIFFVDIGVGEYKEYTLYIKRGADSGTSANPPIIYDAQGCPLYIEIKDHRLPKEGIIVWK